MDSPRSGRPPHPREKANFLSNIFFIWTAKIFMKDRKDNLDVDSMWSPFSRHNTDKLGNKLEQEWESELNRCSKTEKKPSLMRAIFKTFWPQIAVLAVLSLSNQLIDLFMKPTLLRSVLHFFSDKDMTSKPSAYWSGCGLILWTVLNNILASHYAFNAFSLGMLMRASCLTLVYRKTLRISSEAIRTVSAGQVVNLISNDVSRFDVFMMTFNHVWLSPIIAIAVSYFLYDEMGTSGIPGLVLMLVITYCQIFTARLTSKYRTKIAFKTDTRIRLTNEILSGIQVIKMYVWEKSFATLLQNIRSFELKEVFKANNLRGVYMAFGLFTRRLSMYVTLITYVLLGQTLSSASVYVVVLYFNLLSTALTMLFVRGIGEFTEAVVSLSRLENFMLLDETQIPKDKTMDIKEQLCLEDKYSIIAENVTASWDHNAPEETLKDVNIKIKKGQLVLFIGPVASGKTSLIHFILGELNIVKGNKYMSGTFSYSAQESWIFGGTIRDNILLGLPYDRTKYQKVIRACSLDRDFALFQGGDQTMVGERGSSLSGGQKARINLARAIYKDADIYLLDDPFSAVDSHVGRILFRSCIQGFLKGKTVIIATHQHQFMKDADHIILLKTGIIEDQGTFLDLLDKGYKHTLNFSQSTRPSDVGFKSAESAEKQEFETKINRIRMISSASISSSIDDIPSQLPDIEAEDEDPANMDTNIVYKGSPYLGYIKACGNIAIPILFVILFVGAQLSASFTDLFVSYWIMDEEEGARTEASVKTSIVIYTVLVGVLFLTAFSRGIIFFIASRRCSQGLHAQMADSVLSTDLAFFNNNPTGAILNRFARDLGSTDELLPKAILDTSQIFFQAAGAVVVTAVVNVFLLIPFAFLAIVSCLVRSFFMKTSLKLKRLEGICRSPVFTHLSATLPGLVTVRAHGCQSFLVKQFDSHQDLHSSVLYSFISSQQAFTLILDFISLFYLSCVLFTVLYFSDDLFGAQVGLAITQTLTITSMLQWGLRQATETTNLMTSVERVLAFGDLKAEEEEKDRKIIPPPHWPSKGKIEFKNVNLCYNIGQSPTLRNLNLVIQEGEKVGIVGRTGAGKSSLIQALFRLAHVDGQILIDTVDTQNIPLRLLRSRIAIIPQDPVLFSGDLRRNLDPYSDYPDYTLLKALDRLDVPQLLRDKGLDTSISDGGVNISLGERQLICLARAILKNSKIIIMDEATANVDPNTDKVIQTTIRKKFNTCTVLTIAHRLNTVMDSDKLLVMDAGTVVEFDSPHLLLQNTNGYLFRLVEETGRESSRKLTEMAAKTFWRKQQESLLE